MSCRRKTDARTNKEPIRIEMPREYLEHALCKQVAFALDSVCKRTRQQVTANRQVRAVMEEESLQDTEVLFRVGGVCTRMSGFLLSLVSPVLHKMVCGAFKESMSKRLELGEMAERVFMTVVRLACGGSMQVGHVMEVLELAKTADVLQMSDVVEELSATVCRELSVDVCAEVLSASEACGLAKVESRCRCLALEQFEEIAKTASFMDLREESLDGLLDDDDLIAGSEEAVLEALVKWMKGGTDGLRGEALLRNVRYPLMRDEYLAGDVRSLLEDCLLLKDLVSDAVVVKRAARERPGKVEVGRLGSRALLARRGRGVTWARYEEGGERRLEGHTGRVLALAECKGRVCSGSADGSIRIWSKSTLTVERVLERADMGTVYCLASWEGILISGDSDGFLRMWDIANGAFEWAQDGHDACITSLAVCRGRLVSGSEDEMVKVWTHGEYTRLRCERTLTAHKSSVYCLAVWEGKVMSGSRDKTVVVWDVESGARDATLEGHTDFVEALAVTGVRLLSGGSDGTIRAWALGTWEPLLVELAYPVPSHQYVRSMAISGSNLVTGSAGSKFRQKCEVKVWGLERVECQRTLRQPGDATVFCLLGTSGEVWAGVGNEVVVWGRE